LNQPVESNADGWKPSSPAAGTAASTVEARCQRAGEGGILPPDSIAGQFIEQGYAGPVRVFTEAECRQFVKAMLAGQTPPLDWSKGHAASSAAYFGIGSHPALVGILSRLLGENFMLWGASLLTRKPGEVHPWHTDIETADAPGGTVTVWIGMENTTRGSSLLLIPGSHRFGVSVQEIRHRRGKSRGATNTEEIVGWAREYDSRSELAAHDVSDGEALFFDGRLWHGSNNVFHKTRLALLLQYARPDVAIRLPDPKNFNWPFQRLTEPKPPCVMIRGSDVSGVNRIVPRPLIAAEAKPTLPPRVYPLQLPLAPDHEKGWKPYPQFKGAAGGIQNFSCHVSVLNHGRCPHPPHRHEDEEILVMLAGEADLLLPDLPGAEATRQRLRAGEFVFYPAHFAHTLQTVSEQPANYLMFKWKNPGAANATGTTTLPFGRFNLFADAESSGDSGKFPRRRLFDGATGCLRTLHGHVSTLAPGAGYDPHVDPYDVALILLEGSIETLGERVKPHAVIFYPAGRPHGLRNVGDTAARYVVFEFHGMKQPSTAAGGLARRLSSKFVEPDYWKKRFRRLGNSIRKRLP
jgi:quercetin dioxygenase-like cupin family protein